MVKVKEGEQAPPEGGEETPPPKGNETGGGEEITIDEDALKDAIKAVLPGLLKDGETPPKGEQTPPAGGGAPGTMRAQEANVEELVRRELERTTKETERESRLAKVEKAVEKAPTTFKRLTKWMWGSDE